MAAGPRGRQEIAVCVVLVSIALIALILRFAARFKRKLPLKTDDWLALLGQFLIFGMLVVLVYLAMLGDSDRHYQDIAINSPKTLTTIRKLFFCLGLSFALASPCIKLSIVFFYRRLFTVGKFRQVSLCVIILIGVWGLASILLVFLNCIPTVKYWDDTGPNVFLDCLILSLPLPVIWKLRKPWRERLALLAVFLIGAFVCASSVVRTVALKNLKLSDVTATGYASRVWTLVEVCIGQACGCLPIARGLLPPLAPRPVAIPSMASSNSSGGRPSPSARNSATITDKICHKTRLDNNRMVSVQDDEDKEFGRRMSGVSVLTEEDNHREEEAKNIKEKGVIVNTVAEIV